MRRTRAAAASLAALVAAACAAPAPAPSPSPPAAGATAEAPTLTLEPAAFDFGRVLPDRTLHKVFQLRNLGRGRVTIDSVTTDCGCMVVGEYARQLDPGASTALTVQLQTPPQPGTLARSLVVRTGGPSPASLELKLRATVVTEG